jgi:hypothetical protein
MDATNDGDRLPYDVLLDILSRLPCGALVESRRVCRSWRAAVDAHSLLLPYFFPRAGAFPGVFTNNFWSEHKVASDYQKDFASDTGTV